MQCHAVQNGAHGIFPDAEVHVASCPVLRLEVPGAIHVRMSTGSKIGRASHQFGQLRAKDRNRLSRGDARCHGTIGGNKCWQITVPTLRKLPIYDSLEFRSQVRMSLRKSLET